MDAGDSQVRFANADDGWVWLGDSPIALWATYDGGLHWQRPQFPVGTTAASVSDVEASAGVVAATFNGFPIQIETSPVGGDDWTLSPTTLAAGTGGGPSEQIVLQGTVGWVIDVNRTVLGGARLDNRAWLPWSPPCAASGGPAMLAAADTAHLVAVCVQGVYTTSPVVVHAYFSSDGGSTFQAAAATLPPGSVGPIASPAPGIVIVGGAGNLIGTFDGGATWIVVSHQPDTVGWSQVGFTTRSQGVAIANGTLFMTFDGGHQWTPVNLSSAQP